MYRRSKFLEVLIEIRQKMAREADFDTDLFVERVRSGTTIPNIAVYSIVDAVDLDANSQNRKSKSNHSKN